MLNPILLARVMKLKLTKLVNVHTVIKRGVAVSKLQTHQLEVAEKRAIAYKTIPGQKRPTVVMIPGLHSYTHMNGNKAACLLRYVSVWLGWDWLYNDP